MTATTALIYDVHGNLPALQAVLADARAGGVERFLLGGDYALFGLAPAECVAALRDLDEATWIRGNVDRWCAHPDQAPDNAVFEGAIPACREALGEEIVGELDALPESVVIDGTRFCHASPVSDVRSFMPEGGEDDDEMLALVPERRVVFGHTHLQFRRLHADLIELINPGSVGLPLDGDVRAAYALLRTDGSIELRRVDYDNEAAANRLVQQFGRSAWTERSERILLRGHL
jgi:diadenosine tetraphosphatase ApaH/serine/threonine PP2A family protein phosphatase